MKASPRLYPVPILKLFRISMLFVLFWSYSFYLWFLLHNIWKKLKVFSYKSRLPQWISKKANKTFSRNRITHKMFHVCIPIYWSIQYYINYIILVYYYVGISISVFVWTQECFSMWAWYNVRNRYGVYQIQN